MTVSPLIAASATERAERATPSTAPRGADVAVQAQAFEQAMPTASGDAAGPAFYHQSSRSAELRPLQKFEGFVLRNFIESMLPSQNTSFFGTGTAGNIWRSMLAERIGDEMAKAGGVGIAEMLEDKGAQTPLLRTSRTRRPDERRIDPPSAKHERLGRMQEG